MLQQKTHLTEKLCLAAILVLAFFIASIPHLQYAYPLHIDEWWHYGDTQSMLDAGRISYPDPFNSGTMLSTDKEIGFHLLLGELKLVTGISWLTLFRFLPGFIFALLAFQAYAFAKRMRFGLEAAFLVMLIPTTIRFLGPAFLVPVAIGLTFIPLTLFILHYILTELRGTVVLFLIFLSLVFIHPPTLAVVSIIALTYFIIFVLPIKGNTRNQSRQAALGVVFLSVVYLIMFLWAPYMFRSTVQNAMNPEARLALPPIWDALPKFGYIPVGLFVLGVGILIRRGGRRNWALVLVTVGLLAFEQLYPRFYLGPNIVYERGWLYIYVLMSLIGAIALCELGRWIEAVLRQRLSRLAASYTLMGLLAVTALALNLHSRLAEPYYHVIGDTEYQDFLWVKEYVPQQYRIGVINTGVAWAFASVTGKSVYSAEVAPNFDAKGRSAMKFLVDGARDTQWLEEEGVSIVYWPEVIENDALIKVCNNVYLLIK